MLGPFQDLISIMKRRNQSAGIRITEWSKENQNPVKADGTGQPETEIPIMQVEGVREIVAATGALDMLNLLRPQIAAGVATSSDVWEKVSVANARERFEEQRIKSNTRGRASDPVTVDSSLHTGIETAMPEATGVAIDAFVFGRRTSNPPALNDAMAYQCWGVTERWETTACEPGVLGSIEVNFVGARLIACMNFADLVTYLRGKGQGQGQGLQQNKMPHSSMRGWFRNMTQDTSVSFV